MPEKGRPATPHAQMSTVNTVALPPEQRSFHLLGLPLEIRRMIYVHTFASKEHGVRFRKTDDLEESPASLLIVSQQILGEALPVFYERSTFNIYLTPTRTWRTPDSNRLPPFPESGNSHMDIIRHLTISYDIISGQPPDRIYVESEMGRHLRDVVEECKALRTLVGYILASDGAQNSPWALDDDADDLLDRLRGRLERFEIIHRYSERGIAICDVEMDLDLEAVCGEGGYLEFALMGCDWDV